MGPDGVFIELYWLKPMSAHVPSAAHFVIRANGVSKVPVTMNGWVSGGALSLQVLGIGGDHPPYTITYDGLDPLFTDATGDPVGAFTNLLVPF